MKKSTAPRILVSTGMDETDVRYATGLVASDPFVLLRAGRNLHLIVSALEAARAQTTCPAAILHTPASLFRDTVSTRRSLADQILALLRQLKCPAAEIGPWFPAGIARSLEHAGVKLKIVSSPPFPARALKTPDEIAFIAQTQRAAVAAMRAAISTIASAEISPSGVLKHRGRTLTSDRVKDVIEQILLKHRCTANGTIVAGGAQGARPHDEGCGPLRAHQPIVMDIFPRSKKTGYWGDITRTVVRGRASAQVRRMYQTVFAAQQLALSMIRPGTESRAVQQAVERFFVRAGYPTHLTPPGQESGFIHSVGHGLGLDIHESPGLRNEPGRLSAGNVLTVEPGLYLPGVGGVRIEDTLVVTPDGYKILATCPRKLEHGRA